MWSSIKVKYRFVDFFAMVPSSFCKVHYKCINGMLALSSGQIYMLNQTKGVMKVPADHYEEFYENYILKIS